MQKQERPVAWLCGFAVTDYIAIQRNGGKIWSF